MDRGKWESPMPAQVVLSDGFDPLDVIAPCEVLSAVSGLAPDPEQPR